MLRYKSLVLAVFGLAALASGQVSATKVVASVNGEQILGEEYYHRMEFLPGVGRRIGASLVEFPPGFLTLEQLITEKLILQLAKQKGLIPSKAEIEDELHARLESNPKYVDDWLATGKTQADLNQQISLDLAQFKIQTEGVNITDQEVDAYYAEHPNFFTTPQLYKLRIIAVQSDDSKTLIDADLAAGKSFADVASARSEDVTKPAGGDFGSIPLEGIPTAARDAISQTKIGKTTDWIKASDTAWAKFYVEDITPAKLQPLTALLRRNVRRELMIQRGKEKNDVVKQMNDMRTKAKVDIAEKSFSDAYAKFIAAFLKDQAAKAGQ